MNQPTPQEQYWSEIIKLTIAYTNRKHAVWPDPVGREIHKRKNALLYRWSAVWWHVSLAEQAIVTVRSQARNPENRGNLPFILANKRDHGYLFDDAVFNLISMFDYLAGLIGLVLTSDVHKWHKWNSLVKTVRANDFDRPKASEMLINAHQGWVDKLSGYRAGVYHEKSDIGGAEYLEDLERAEVQVRYFVPEGAMRVIPIFKGRDKVDLTDGLREIVEKSCLLQRQILEKFLEEDI